MHLTRRNASYSVAPGSARWFTVRKLVVSAFFACLIAVPSRAAVTVQLDCPLYENQDGRTTELFAIDFAAKTVLVHTVAYDGSEYAYAPRTTFPARIAGNAVSWDDGSMTYRLVHEGSTWTAYTHYPNGEQPDTTKCDVWTPPKPGESSQ